MVTLTFLMFILILFQINSGLCEFSKIADLSWDFDNETIYWKGIQPFVTTKVVGGESRGYWYSMKEFCAGEHGGTHFDAPYHFYKYGWKVADVPVERLVAKGVLLDLSNETTLSGCNNLTLKTSHLESWEKNHGVFEQGSVLLVKFGMSKYWPDKEKYSCSGPNGDLETPGLSEEAANWIAKSKKFYGVGLDTLSIDVGSSSNFMVHRIFAENSMYNLENVKLVEELPVRGFTLIVSPMKIKEGTGAPVRILAVPANRI